MRTKSRKHIRPFPDRQPNDDQYVIKLSSESLRVLVFRTLFCGLSCDDNGKVEKVNSIWCVVSLAIKVTHSHCLVQYVVNEYLHFRKRKV